MSDIGGDSEGSRPMVRARVRLRCSVRMRVGCSVRSTLSIGLHFQLGSACDVRVRARLTFRNMVMCG